MTAVNIFFILAFIATTSGTRVRRDLGSVCQDMWNAAGNNMIVGKDLDVDTSPNPPSGKQLFTLSGSGQTKLNSQVYVRFKALLDNYVLDETKPDLSDAQKSQEEDNFINTIAVTGGPVEIAYKYLLANKKTSAKDLNAFKAVLKKMWFSKYSKGGSNPTYSGFEHTFVGEVGLDKKKKKVVKGLHNWYQFHLEQSVGRLGYTPPPKNVVNSSKQVVDMMAPAKVPVKRHIQQFFIDGFFKEVVVLLRQSSKLGLSPPLINVAFNWNSASKPPGSSFYVGTSPAFEIALYTACFFGEPGDCTCSIGGQQLMIKTIDFKNAGMVLTSYPVA